MHDPAGAVLASLAGMPRTERTFRKRLFPLLLAAMALIVIYFIAHQLLIVPNEPNTVGPGPVVEPE